MSSRLLFAKEFLQANVESVSQRLRAIVQSFRFRPGQLADVQFMRYVGYREIETRLVKLGLSAEARIIKFGASNGVICDMLQPDHQVEVAPNYPDVDIQSLTQYEDECCDFVILDQILEHVAAPSRRSMISSGFCAPAVSACARHPF